MRAKRAYRLLLGVFLLAATSADAVKRRAFVTSVSGTGDLGSWTEAGDAVGLDAGDAICRARAAAGGLPNASTYRAWLSTEETDAYCHVKGLTGKKGSCTGGHGDPAGPWYLAGGTTSFTGTLDELTEDGVIYRPVVFDEFLTELPAPTYLWTGTSPSGEGNLASEFSCDGWTSDSALDDGRIGRADGTAARWTATGAQDCDLSRRILCFEPGTSEEAIQGWSPGSIVFVTSKFGTGVLGDWPEAGGAVGIDAGDAICRQLAATAHLPAPESFVAWLSDDDVYAKDRLTAPGPYRRIDGYAIANSEADLLDGATSTSIHVDEKGRYLLSTRFVWTGSSGAGTTHASCGDWGSIGGIGMNGSAALSRSEEWSESLIFDCDSSSSLYCFSNAVTIFWDGFDLTGDPSRWSDVVPEL